MNPPTLLAIAILLVLCSPITAQDEARIFTGHDGKRIAAVVLAVKGDQATIRLVDGTVHRLSFDKFSPEDQKYLRNWRPAPGPPAKSDIDAKSGVSRLPELSIGDIRRRMLEQIHDQQGEPSNPNDQGDQPNSSSGETKEFPTKVFYLPPGSAQRIGDMQFMMVGWKELDPPRPQPAGVASRRIAVDYIVVNLSENRSLNFVSRNVRMVDAKGNVFQASQRIDWRGRPQVRPGDRRRYRMEFVVPADASGLKFVYAGTTSGALPYDLEYLPFMKIHDPDWEGPETLQTPVAINADVFIGVINVAIAMKNLGRHLPGAEVAEMHVALTTLGVKPWSFDPPERIEGEKPIQPAAPGAGIETERLTIYFSAVPDAQEPRRDHRWDYPDCGYVPVKISVTNRGIETYKLAPSDFFLIDSNCFAYEAADLLQHKAIVGDWHALLEVPPGANRTFRVVYRALREHGGLMIRYVEGPSDRSDMTFGIYHGALSADVLKTVVYESP